MDKSYKQAWVNALRSGKYRQGKRGLHNSMKDTYCCLGVLCDIAVQRGDLGRYKDATGSRWYVFMRPLPRKFFGLFKRKTVNTDELSCSLYETVTLPDWLANQLNIENYQVTRLIDMNDGQNSSFDEIANYIEKEL